MPGRIVSLRCTGSEAEPALLRKVFLQRSAALRCLGITGAVLGPIIARLARIDDPRVVGLTMGIASHGIGTARTLQINEVAGAFSGLGMGLNGVLTAILLPLIFRLL